MGRSESTEKRKVTTVYLDKRAVEEKQQEEEIEEQPKRKVIYYLGAAVCLTLYPWVFALIWNWVVPSVFGLSTIGYVKALGILTLSFMLFRK